MQKKLTQCASSTRRHMRRRGKKHFFYHLCQNRIFFLIIKHAGAGDGKNGNISIILVDGKLNKNLTQKLRTEVK